MLVLILIIGMCVLGQWYEQAYPADFMPPYADNGTKEREPYYVETWPDSHEWLKDMGWLTNKSESGYIHQHLSR